MIDKVIVQINETQKMTHGREHALADMVSTKVNFCSGCVTGEGEECEVGVTMLRRLPTLGTCLPPKRRS